MGFICPTISRRIQGKAYTLQLDFSAVVLAEQISGVRLLDPDAWHPDNQSVGTVTAIFFAAAVQTDPDLKLEDFRKLKFDVATRTEMVKAITEAWRAVNDTTPEVPRPTVESKPVGQADGEA